LYRVTQFILPTRRLIHAQGRSVFNRPRNTNRRQRQLHEGRSGSRRVVQCANFPRGVQAQRHRLRVRSRLACPLVRTVDGLGPRAARGLGPPSARPKSPIPGSHDPVSLKRNQHGATNVARPSDIRRATTRSTRPQERIKAAPHADWNAQRASAGIMRQAWA